MEFFREFASQSVILGISIQLVDYAIQLWSQYQTSYDAVFIMQIRLPKIT